MWVFMLSTCLVAAAPREVELHTLAGETARGQLTELGRERIVLSADGRARSFRPEDVLQISLVSAAPVRAAAPKVWLTLVDGSTLLGAEFTSTASKAHLSMADGASIDLDSASIATVRLRALTKSTAEQWATILESAHASDLLVVRKDDAVDFLEGVVRDVGAEKVQFELDGEVLEVPRTKLDGFVYYHPGRADLPQVACQITTTDGSQLAARSVSLDDESWRVVTRGGLELSLPAGAIARLDYSQGKVVYLSDLAWDERRSRWEPYFGLATRESALEQFYAPRRDRAFEGPQLMLGRTAFAKGLALRSRTELVYRLPDSFRRFTAVVGIDDAVGDAGDVHVVIRGGERVLYEADLTGRDAAVPLDLDVQGVRELTILVDYGRDGDVADQLNLCDAKVIK